MRSGGPGAELTPNQRRAARLLAGGLNLVDIAERIGVHANTLTRWKRIERFRTLVLQHEQAQVGAAREELQAAVVRAAQVVVDAMDGRPREDGGRITKAQVAAALEILDRLGVTGKFQIEHSGPGGTPIQHDHDHTHRVDLSNLSPEQIEAFARGRIAAGGGDVDNLPQPGRITIDARVQQAPQGGVPSLPEPGGNGSSAKAKSNGKLKAKKAAKKRGVGKKGEGE